MNKRTASNGFRRVDYTKTFLRRVLLLSLILLILVATLALEKLIYPWFDRPYLYLKTLASALVIYLFLNILIRELLAELNRPVFYSIVPSYVAFKPRS